MHELSKNILFAKHKPIFVQGQCTDVLIAPDQPFQILKIIQKTQTQTVLFDSLSVHQSYLYFHRNHINLVPCSHEVPYFARKPHE